MQTDTIHPLQAYLDKHGEGVRDFSARAEVSFSAVYALLRGQMRNPLAEWFQRIQTATGGEVSIAEMLDWQRKYNIEHPLKPRAAKPPGPEPEPLNEPEPEPTTYAESDLPAAVATYDE